jgi:hypothetical protein
LLVFHVLPQRTQRISQSAQSKLTHYRVMDVLSDKLQFVVRLDRVYRSTSTS